MHLSNKYTHQNDVYFVTRNIINTGRYFNQYQSGNKGFYISNIFQCSGIKMAAPSLVIKWGQIFSPKYWLRKWISLPENYIYMMLILLLKSSLILAVDLLNHHGGIQSKLISCIFLWRKMAAIFLVKFLQNLTCLKPRRGLVTRTSVIPPRIEISATLWV